jgi:hypothetical protein
MRKKVASGAIAGVATVSSTVVGMMWQHIDPLVGMWILIGCGIVFLIAMLVMFWPGGEGDQKGGIGVRTSGLNSPGVGTVGRDFHYHNHPQPATNPLPSWAREMGLATYRIDRNVRPETPIWQALTVIASRIGDKDEANGFPMARREFRQAALDGVVTAWGQQDIPSQHLKDNRHKDVWRPIEPEYWHDYKLNILAANPSNEEHWHTEDEEVPTRRGSRFWNLRVELSDISKRWPVPPEPRKSKRSHPGGSTGWMAGS